MSGDASAADCSHPTERRGSYIATQAYFLLVRLAAAAIRLWT